MLSNNRGCRWRRVLSRAATRPRSARPPDSECETNSPQMAPLAPVVACDSAPRTHTPRRTCTPSQNAQTRRRQAASLCGSSMLRPSWTPVLAMSMIPLWSCSTGSTHSSSLFPAFPHTFPETFPTANPPTTVRFLHTLPPTITTMIHPAKSHIDPVRRLQSLHGFERPTLTLLFADLWHDRV